jgi:hypothetical protein
MKKFYSTESFKKFYRFSSLSSLPVFFKRPVFIGVRAQEVKGLAMNQRQPKHKQWLEILNHIYADYAPSHGDKERVCRRWNKK